MISEDQVKKFQGIYRIETGQDISYEEASLFAKNLVDLVRTVYRPIKKSTMEKQSKNGII